MAEGSAARSDFLMRWLSRFALIVALVPALALGQTVQSFTIDPYPAGKPGGTSNTFPLEKAVGFFTSTTVPSVVVGFNRGWGGLYLYTSSSGDLSGPWARTAIDPVGDFYEGMAAFLNPGDIYPGIIASRSRQIIWYHNPVNGGGDVTKPWEAQIINPNAGCHELRIADLDQDGLPDVLCSGSVFEEARSFIAFQNDRDHWQIVDDPFKVGRSIARIVGGSGSRLGGGISPISIAGGPRINVVGATNSGVYWFRNPKLVLGNPRTDPWLGSYVGDGNLGLTIATGVFNGSREDIIVASSEPVPTPWPSGLAWYEQPRDPTQTWFAHSVGSTFRAVHQINTGKLNGVPYFIVAEQEQACGTPRLPGQHAGIPCRVTMFRLNNDLFTPFTIYEHGSHNQSVISYDGGLLVVGANHGYYGSLYPALQAWLIRPKSGEGSRPVATH
jgi:hypothetical protein